MHGDDNVPDWLVKNIDNLVEELVSRVSETSMIYNSLPKKDSMKKFYEGKLYGLQSSLYTIQRSLQIPQNR